MMKAELKIDFVGVAEEKSATSWIYRCLEDHPEIYVPRQKEINFFSEKYDLGLDWYKSFFEECPQGIIKGEYTAIYSLDPRVAQRIKKHFPDSKIICCLRNPIDKEISNYHYLLSRGKINCNIDTYFKSLDLEKLLYYKNMSQFINIFPRENLLILIYDDIKKDQVKFIQRIYQFLGVKNFNYIPKIIDRRINQTYSNRFRIIFVNRILWSAYRKIKCSHYNKIIIKLLKTSGIHYIVKKIFYLNLRKKNLFPSEKQIPSLSVIENIKKYCKGDLKKMEKFINKDLSHWYN